MAKLKNYNGKYCESDYEYAFISFLEHEDWKYLPGDQMKRVYGRDVLNTEDLEAFIRKTNPDLNADEIKQISDTVRLVGAETDFATLHKVYGWMVDGIQFTPQNGQARMIALIDYEEPKNNMFKV
ncbi:MAG: type I restriction endonuclease subunit R, partial [Clostridia bacterium]|nr:type I restriction endonuclease subunit R [Clostridia bacterium]